MSEILLLLGQRTRVQLLREQKRLWAVQNYSEVIRRSAQAVRLVADDRDAYVYYRVGEELGLDWDLRLSQPAAPRYQRCCTFLREQSPCRTSRSKQGARANGPVAQ